MVKLQIIDDFVIVTDKHHSHFDVFKKEKCDSHVSYISLVELILFWSFFMKKSFSML